MADVELVHVHGGEPGLRRLGSPGTFSYINPDGEPVTGPETLERIAELRIPPAWTDVWIAARPEAHLQATGGAARVWGVVVAAHMRGSPIPVGRGRRAARPRCAADRRRKRTNRGPHAG
jgi:hypothetical protein